MTSYSSSQEYGKQSRRKAVAVSGTFSQDYCSIPRADGATISLGDYLKGRDQRSSTNVTNASMASKNFCPWYAYSLCARGMPLTDA